MQAYALGESLMSGTENSGGLKLAILVGLLAVLGYFWLQESGWISPRADSESRPQTSAPSATQANSASTEITGERLRECVEVASDTRLSPSSDKIVSSPTADLRPVWVVSGRVRNVCQTDLSDLSFRIEVSRKKTGELLDTAEILLKGTAFASTTRGFVQNVQLRIPSPDWTWDMTPERARLPVGSKGGEGEK
jgi:hypothetical protein